MSYVQPAEKPSDSEDGQIELPPGADSQCFICRAVADTSADRRRYVVERSQHSVTILNCYPYNNGHLLIAPRLHRARLDQLTPEEQLELVQVIARMVALLEKVLHPQGFNVGLNLGRAAGAGLPGHLHWHVVPRWSGDTNFMPVLASIDVIPQSLDALWGLLVDELARQRSAGNTPEGGVD